MQMPNLWNFTGTSENNSGLGDMTNLTCTARPNSTSDCPYQRLHCVSAEARWAEQWRPLVQSSLHPPYRLPAHTAHLRPHAGCSRWVSTAAAKHTQLTVPQQTNPTPPTPQSTWTERVCSHSDIFFQNNPMTSSPANQHKTERQCSFCNMFCP